MTDDTTRPPRTPAGLAMIRDCAAWGIDPALAAESVVRIETEAAAPDAGLREAALDPNYSDEFIGNLYRAALAAHRSSDPSPAPAPDRCSECGRAFEVIPHVHEGVKCEPKHIHDLYGTSTTQGRQMLIARRLLEHGVRFVQVWTGSGLPWDCHEENESTHRKLGRETDQPIAGLLRDLKQRGMLEDTLVVWGGEFSPDDVRNGGHSER